MLKPEVAQTAISSTAQSLAATHGGQVGFVYQHALKGFSMQATEANAIALSNNSSVDYVTEDSEVSVSGTPTQSPFLGAGPHRSAGPSVK